MFNCSLYCVSWNCFACTFVTLLIKINQSINSGWMSRNQQCQKHWRDIVLVKMAALRQKQSSPSLLCSGAREGARGLSPPNPPMDLQ